MHLKLLGSAWQPQGGTGGGKCRVATIANNPGDCQFGKGRRGKGEQAAEAEGRLPNAAG